jgi:hypothetical protein
MIDPRTGRMAGSAMPESASPVEEWYFTSQPPLPAAAEDYDANGHVVLDERYAAWLKDNVAASETFVLGGEGKKEAVIRPLILVPADGATYFVDPELPGSGRRLNVKTNLPGEVAWECDSLSVHREGTGWWLDLKPGQHVLRLREPSSGREAESRFVVKSL